MWLISRGYGLISFVVIFLLHWIWIHETIGSNVEYNKSILLYHHAQAFIFYFFGGCLLGYYNGLNNSIRFGRWLCLAVVFAGFFIMLIIGRSGPEKILLGWRGLLLMLVCFVMVGMMANQVFQHAFFGWIAKKLGDASYGLYLLHPVFYFGITFIVLPHLDIQEAPESWSFLWKISFIFGIFILAFVMALASDHYFERPIRDWAKKLRFRG